MNRFLPLVTCLLIVSLLIVPSTAEDPPKKPTPAERFELEEKAQTLNSDGLAAHRAGKLDKAVKACTEALQINRRLYPTDDYPDGHANLSRSLNNLGHALKDQEKYTDAEPLLRDALAMNKRLFKGDHNNVARSLTNLAIVLDRQGKYADAEPLYRDALAMSKNLHPNQDDNGVAVDMSNLAYLLRGLGKYAESESLYRSALAMQKRLFPNQDHPALATSINNLGRLLEDRKQYAEAELHFREALAMNNRIYKGDHNTVALNTNNLAGVLRNQGKLAAAEPLLREVLAMYKRLYPKRDHPDVANSMNHLGALLRDLEQYAEAETLFCDSLAMEKRLHPNRDHAAVATGMNNLALAFKTRGQYADAELLYRDALAMRKRLYPNQDHAFVATSMNNLGALLNDQKRYKDAEPYFRDALAMRKRLYPNLDHHTVASTMASLANLYFHLGRYADSESLHRDSLAVERRRIAAYAAQSSEGEALTLIASLPVHRGDYLMNALRMNADPRGVFAEVWAFKGVVSRVYEVRQQAARAAVSDPKAAGLLVNLADARRRRAERLLAPEVKDPATRKEREEAIKALEEEIANLDRSLRPLLPVIARAEKLANATPLTLQQALPADVAVVDFIRFTIFGVDDDKTDIGAKRVARYLAFVVTRDTVAWVDLAGAAKIDHAVEAWRDAITSGKDIPTALPAKVRELVWENVRKELPARIKTVYLCPDADLSKVPWGALPGDKPGTILLEDFAVATIPHAPFLLDKLWPQESAKNPPAGALVVGGVKYDADLTTPAPGAVASRSGDPLLKPGAKLGWSYLPGTAAEATGVFGAAAAKKLTITSLVGEKATAPAALAALPNAKYAHFATHGFFADPSFRSVFQLDEKDYEQSSRGERIGRAANSPLLMTGLVFAGANNPKTPGRGIVTGESLIDLDLAGLDLAVLSACETGLGALGNSAGGEGTFGLQRAFHYAGTRDVIASLWKVPDQSTAALMALFYRNLWTQNLTPMESLRQAQLDIYRDPSKIPELAKGFRGKFEEVPGAIGVEDVKPGKDGKAHPLLWAAFTLSGPGR